MKKLFSILTLTAVCAMSTMSVFAGTLNVKVSCEDEKMPSDYDAGVAVDYGDAEKGPYVIKAPQLDGYVAVDDELTAETVADIENLEFKYRKVVNYTVKHVDAKTGEELADSETKSGACGSEVTAEPIPIDGYVAQEKQDTLILDIDETQNVVTCKYNQNDDDIVLSDTDKKDNKVNKADKKADAKKAPTSSNVAAAATTGVPGEPNTGDESLVVLYGVLAVMSLAGAGTFAYKKTR